jgi:hypothetical protein
MRRKPVYLKKGGTGSGHRSHPFLRDEEQRLVRWQLKNFFLPAVLVAPVAARVLLDCAPFGGDQSQYASAAASLYAALLNDPATWFGGMLDTMRFKPPGLPWVGQFFLPLTAVGLPVDKALLASIVTALLIALIMLGQAARVFSLGSRALLVGVLALTAGTPLLQNAATQYMTEVPQFLVVCWFLLIMTRARTWGRSLLLGQLTLAGMAAALTKSSTPFYVVIPGMVAAAQLISWPGQARSWNSFSRGSVLTWGAVAVVAIPTVPWFALHWPEVAQHARFSTMGEAAAIWGTEDSYLNTLWFWLTKTLAVFPFLALGAAAFAGSLILGPRQLPEQQEPGGFGRGSHLLPLACLAQLLLVLLMAAFSSNRELRYLLPLLPYAALLAAWSFDRLGSQPVRVAFAGMAATFWLAASAVSLGVVPAWGAPGWHYRLLTRDAADLRLLESVVERTSTNPGTTGHAVMIAVDPIFFLDWLAPEPATYTAWKEALRQGKPAPTVTFHYAGNSFLGAEPNDTWRHLLDLRPRFIVACDPGVYPPEKARFNRSLRGDNARLLLARIEESGLFFPPVRLPENQGLLLFQAR